MIVRPNPGPNFSAANYAAKAARWKALWPEITVLPADNSAVVPAYAGTHIRDGVVREADLQNAATIDRGVWVPARPRE